MTGHEYESVVFLFSWCGEAMPFLPVSIFNQYSVLFTHTYIDNTYQKNVLIVKHTSKR